MILVSFNCAIEFYKHRLKSYIKVVYFLIKFYKKVSYLIKIQEKKSFYICLRNKKIISKKN